MTHKHRVLIGPGMDGKTAGLNFLTRNWPKKYNLYPHILPITWKDNEPFAPKLKRITDLIDSYVSQGDMVSLIGCSASGSAMLNAFLERRNKVHRVVNNDGFLRPGKAKGIRSFAQRSAQSIAFRESVIRFAKLEHTLTTDETKKILTIRPQFGDELVPPDTVVIAGALNLTVPMGEHVLSIAYALVAYKPVIMFLTERG